MTADDAAWAAGLMERRRQVYAAYSPVFWRPRPGVTGLHARFLGRQLASPGCLAVRTGHGFLIGQRRGRSKNFAMTLQSHAEHPRRSHEFENQRGAQLK